MMKETEMLKQLWSMFQDLTGIPTDQLALSLQEIPSAMQWRWDRSCKPSVKVRGGSVPEELVPNSYQQTPPQTPRSSGCATLL